jgi:hypothetical protein
MNELLAFVGWFLHMVLLLFVCGHIERVEKQLKLLRQEQHVRHNTKDGQP